MKVEIDTINKTIKIVDDCSASEFLKFFLELENYMEYKLIPNTIINTIKIRDNDSLKWINPNPWRIGTPVYDPYRVMCYNQNYSTNTAILDTINTNNLRNDLCEEK